MKVTRIQGIVIREVNTGEADKILTIFSKRLGKIQAVARGARRPQSRYIAGTQFLSFSDFVLYKGKELYNVQSCELIETFYNVRESLEKITYASHIVDIINEVSEENLSYSRVLQLLLNTLHVLSYFDKSPELISRIFEIRLMSIIGFSPEVTQCNSCGTSVNENIFFSSRNGGILCQDCSFSEGDIIKISPSTLSALRYIIYSDIKKIFSFDVSSNVLIELKIISERFLNTHINKNFSKLKFLEELKTGESND